MNYLTPPLKTSATQKNVKKKLNTISHEIKADRTLSLLERHKKTSAYPPLESCQRCYLCGLVAGQASQSPTPQRTVDVYVSVRHNLNGRNERKTPPRIYIISPRNRHANNKAHSRRVNASKLERDRQEWMFQRPIKRMQAVSQRNAQFASAQKWCVHAVGAKKKSLHGDKALHVIRVCAIDNNECGSRACKLDTSQEKNRAN